MILFLKKVSTIKPTEETDHLFLISSMPNMTTSLLMLTATAMTMKTKCSEKRLCQTKCPMRRFRSSKTKSPTLITLLGTVALVVTMIIRIKAISTLEAQIQDKFRPLRTSCIISMSKTRRTTKDLTSQSLLKHLTR